MTGTSDKMINLWLQMLVAMVRHFRFNKILYMLNFFPGGVLGGKMLVKIIIVSYGTPLVLAFNFDFLSPVEPVKIIPRISSRNKKNLSFKSEKWTKNKTPQKRFKNKKLQNICVESPKSSVAKTFLEKKTKENS